MLWFQPKPLLITKRRSVPAGFCLRLHHQELRCVLRPLLRLCDEASDVLRQPRPTTGGPAVGEATPPEDHQAVPEEDKKLMEEAFSSPACDPLSTSSGRKIEDSSLPKCFLFLLPLRKKRKSIPLLHTRTVYTFLFFNADSHFLLEMFCY